MDKDEIMRLLEARVAAAYSEYKKVMLPLLEAALYKSDPKSTTHAGGLAALFSDKEVS